MMKVNLVHEVEKYGSRIDVGPPCLQRRVLTFSPTVVGISEVRKVARYSLEAVYAAKLAPPPREA